MTKKSKYGIVCLHMKIKEIKSYHRPLTLQEYADLVGLSYITIYRYLKKGEINYFTMGNKKGVKRKILIPYEELPTFVRKSLEEN